MRIRIRITAAVIAAAAVLGLAGCRPATCRPAPPAGHSGPAAGPTPAPDCT
jgi:hypothetical protein